MKTNIPNFNLRYLHDYWAISGEISRGSQSSVEFYKILPPTHCFQDLGKFSFSRYPFAFSIFYGFVIDGESGESVLANNPDLNTDAGQFAMIESVTPKDKKVRFEFVAAVPTEKDISQFANGIGPLNFQSLRIISFPGGQQYGAISPCEMNEFSDECEAWEAENGPWEKGKYMMRSNPRTKGR